MTPADRQRVCRARHDAGRLIVPVAISEDVVEIQNLPSQFPQRA
jgi:hypothetical protein